MLNYGWFFEELLATQGALYVDNENGRKDAAKKAVFNGKEGQKVFGMLDELNKSWCTRKVWSKLG